MRAFGAEASSFARAMFFGEPPVDELMRENDEFVEPATQHVHTGLRYPVSTKLSMKTTLFELRRFVRVHPYCCDERQVV